MGRRLGVGDTVPTSPGAGPSIPVRVAPPAVPYVGGMSDAHGPTAGRPVLVGLAGLPGSGKTTLAREVAVRLDAAHLRIDTIEAALTSSGLIEAAGGWRAAPDAGCRVAYALARDLLAAGHHVVADSVNPLAATRFAWARVASDAGSGHLDVEVVCSDRAIHQRRVEARTSDLDGLRVPTWAEVESRHYEPWDPPVVTVDTTDGIDEAVETVVSLVGAASQGLP